MKKLTHMHTFFIYIYIHTYSQNVYIFKFICLFICFLGYSPLLTGKLGFIVNIEIRIYMLFNPIFLKLFRPCDCSLEEMLLA